jgi:4-amino-4-deoxy-L-arabinose transferase-like glycosyltransferase
MPGPPESGAPGRKAGARTWLVILLLCAVSGAFAYAGFDKYPATIGDNAEFVVLARSIASGHGFSYINSPDARPATKYPPGFPLMLAAWSAVAGDTFVSYKIALVLTYILTIPLAFLLGRKLIGNNLAIIAALMVASSTSYIRYSHTVLSEMPYALASLAVLYLVMYRPDSRRNLALVVALSVWAYYLRSVGGTLVLAVAAYYLLTSRKKYALAVLGALVAATLVWTLRNYAVAGEGSRYLSVLLKVDPYHPHEGDINIAGLFLRMGKNLVGYSGEIIAYTILPSYHVRVAGTEVSMARNIISLAVFLLAGFGGFTLRRQARLVNIYLVLYILAYLVWPDVWMSDRFMVPIAPILAIYTVQGIYRLLSLLGSGRRAALIACVAVLLTNAYALTLYTLRERGYTPLWANYIQCAVWCAHNTLPDDLIVCRKPFFFYIFSDRQTISYPFTEDHEEMRAYLREWGADYIIVDYFGGPTGTTELYVLPVLLDMIGSVKTVYATGEPLNMVVKLNVTGLEAGE